MFQREPLEADRPTTNGHEDKTDKTKRGLTQMYADMSVGESGKAFSLEC